MSVIPCNCFAAFLFYLFIYLSIYYLLVLWKSYTNYTETEEKKCLHKTHVDIIDNMSTYYLCSVYYFLKCQKKIFKKGDKNFKNVKNRFYIYA